MVSLLLNHFEAVYHGGHFVNIPTKSHGLELNYVGGKTFLMSKCDLDDWSLQEITFELKKRGYKGFVHIFYR